MSCTDKPSKSEIAAVYRLIVYINIYIYIYIYIYLNMFFINPNCGF